MHNVFKFREILYESTILNESLIMNNDDIIINFNSWKAVKNHNILYVTGLSGSGKTTLAEEYEKKYKAKMFEIDGIEHDYDSTKSGLLDKAKKEFPDYLEILKDHYTVRSESSDVYKLYDKVYNFIVKEMKNSPDTLYIIEGLQLYQFVDIETLKSKPIIIKGTSATTSLIRRIKRNNNGSVNWLAELKKNVPQLAKQYYDDDKRLSRFKSNIK